MRIGGVRPTAAAALRRRAPVAVATVMTAVVIGATACTPPTIPAPGVIDPGEGRGREPSQAVAPSNGCATGPASDVSTQEVTPEEITTEAVTTEQVTIEWGGELRRAVVRTPAGTAPGVPAPLLLSLHPFALDDVAWEEYSGLAAAAVERGYVVVSPLGSLPGPRWAVPGGLDTGVDDLGFVNALLDRVEDTRCIDRNRVVAAGFSAGAAMAQALSCTLPDRIAAIAGSGGGNLTELCADSPPTDTFLLHGTADAIAPPTGSEVIFATPLGLPISDVAATNAARAGCAPDPLPSSPFAGVTALDWSGCEDGHRVRFWSMEGAGHVWAGSRSWINLFLGPVPDFSANDVVLDFFDAT